MRSVDQRLERTRHNAEERELDSGAARSDAVSDEDLAVLAHQGSQPAFEQLFTRHRFRVARIAGRFFNRPERVDDIVQDSFVKAYFGLGDYSPEKGASFAAWLSRIAINSCYDHLRRDRRRLEHSMEQVTEDEALRLKSRLHGNGIPSDAESNMISRDLATKLLSRLGAEDRIVLGLLDIDGMSVGEISDMTGWSKSKVKVRVHRARSALRKILREYV